MSNKPTQSFSFGSVDFTDQDSIDALYGGGGGDWTDEKVTIVDSGFTLDAWDYRSRSLPGDLEIAFFIDLHFHSQGMQERVGKIEESKRGVLTHHVYSLGKKDLGQGVQVVKANGELCNPDSSNVDDLRGVSLTFPAGYHLWTKSDFFLFHKYLSQVSSDNPQWIKAMTPGTNDGSLFTGIEAIACQAEKPLTEAYRQTLTEKHEREAAEAKAQGETYYPRFPMIAYLDQVTGYNPNVSKLSSFDSSAPAITDEAIAFIKAQVTAGTAKIAAIQKAALNDNPALHADVMVATQDVKGLESYGLVWAKGGLALA